MAIVLPFINRFSESINGGPFAIGDKVQIITKPYRGFVSHIYKLGQGVSLHVDIGDEAKKLNMDGFTPSQLIKENTTVFDEKQTHRSGCDE